MADRTKYALKEALYEVIKDKPLSKVTISDITDKCGVSRMTFYYHFKDIEGLIAWVCKVNSEELLLNNRDIIEWQDAYRAILEASHRDKAFVLNVYNSVSREEIRDYMLSVMDVISLRLFQLETKNLNISIEDGEFITRFSDQALAGLYMDWLEGGMNEEDIDEVVNNVYKILTPAIPAILNNFAK